MEKKGFVLIEVVIVLAVLGALLILGPFFDSQLEKRETIWAGAEEILACLSRTQERAMSGESFASAGSNSFGVKFFSDHYIAFAGINPEDYPDSHLSYQLSPSLEIKEIDLPGHLLVFTKGSGEILNFTATQSAFILKEKNSGGQVRIRINKLGRSSLEKL